MALGDTSMANRVSETVQRQAPENSRTQSTDVSYTANRAEAAIYADASNKLTIRGNTRVLSQMTLDWDAIGAVGEILGALAVFISLVYLAAQIKQNTRSVSTAATQSVLENLNAALQIGATSRSNARVIIVGLNDIDSLDTDEQMQFTLWISSFLRTLELAHIHYERDLIDKDVWAGFEAQFAAILQSPSAQRVWQARRAMFGRRFREFIEGLPADPEVPTHIDSSETLFGLRGKE